MCGGRTPAAMPVTRAHASAVSGLVAHTQPSPVGILVVSRGAVVAT